MNCVRLVPILVSIGIMACNSDAPPPNIVLIIGDDFGYPYFGFMGSDLVETPNLDQLAKEGTTFTHGFTTASWCRPSLWTLLTGLHFDPRTPDWLAQDLDSERRSAQAAHIAILDRTALPRLLGGQGYVSFQGGKYWEGDPSVAGFTTGTHDFEGDNIGQVLAGGSGLRLGRETMQPLWEFLDVNGHTHPFFVWFAPALPHRPHDAGEEFLDPYRNRDILTQAQLYYANITRFDASVGELLRYLDEKELRSDTLVVFISDNGWEQSAHRATNEMIGGDRGKHSIYEYGFRTPIIFSWPGHIDEGVMRRELVSSVDLFPTLLDYAGIDTPPGRMGISLYPLLSKGGTYERRQVIGEVQELRDPSLRKRQYRLEPERAYFLRDSVWRYVWFSDRQADELYRIEEDPREAHNLIAKHRPRAIRYRAEIQSWRRKIRESRAQ